MIEAQSASEHVPVVKSAESVRIKPALSDQAEAFLVDIDTEFVRFQNFYDRANSEMYNYRVAHVSLITSVYNQLLTVFGDDFDAIYTLMDDLDGYIETKTTEVGSVNTCIQGIIDEKSTLAIRVSDAVLQCALVANTTLNTIVSDYFYPTFITIQTDLTQIPLTVLDVLARGNILNDEQDILDLLRSRYEVIEIQWLNWASQVLRWESNRFEVEGLFLVDDNAICLAEPIIDLIFTYSTLSYAIRDC